jgi:hypothetical protein
MAKFGAAIIGVGSVSAAVYGMSRLFKQFGDLADISDMLAVDTKALVGFQLAAAEAGVSAEDLQNSIRFLLKTVGNEALSGGSVAGLNARNLLGLPTEEIVLRVADAIAKIPDRASRAAVEVKALGKAGAKLDVVFKGGRVELEKFIELTNRLGTGLSRFEVGRLDLVTDDVNRLAEAYKGLALTIAGKLAPAIDEQVTATTLGVMALTRSLKGVNAGVTEAERIGRSELLPEKAGFLFGIPSQKFLTQAEWSKKRQQMLMGPPAPLAESDFDRRVREDMERKKDRREQIEKSLNEKGAKGSSGMRVFDAVDIALNSARASMAGLAGRSSTAFDNSLSTGVRGGRMRDNPMLDRLGRDLHDVVNDELQFRKGHGGTGRVPGLPFGATIQGWRDPDFPKGADSDVVQRAGILSEMRTIGMEGNLSKAQLDAQRKMVAILERIERDKGGFDR